MKGMFENARRAMILNKIFTYLFLILLSVVIIYPLLITASSAFRVGNVAAFRLDFSGSWTLDHFRRLFEETLYLHWYGNTLVIALSVMVLQVAVVTIAGYAYSRYRFPAENKALSSF